MRAGARGHHPAYFLRGEFGEARHTDHSLYVPDGPQEPFHGLHTGCLSIASDLTADKAAPLGATPKDFQLFMSLELGLKCAARLERKRVLALPNGLMTGAYSSKNGKILVT